MRPRQQPKSDQVTVTEARAQLANLLVTARSIASFTAADLARRYRVPLREIEQRLDNERTRRERLL